MQKYINDIIGTSGSTLSPITGATCSVYLTGTSTLATLYSDNGVTPKANPISSSSTGRIEFYAADGRYDISVVKSGYTTVTLADILLEDLADATPGVFTTVSASQTFRTTGYSSPASGAGLEIDYGVSVDTGRILSYDRTASAAKYLQLAGLTVEFKAGSGLSSVGTFTSTGLNSAAIGATTPSTGAITTLSATGTLSGGTSGTGYSFSGSAAAGSLTLDSSGNLGIGTSSPAYKLDVVGNAGIARIQSTGSGQNSQLNLQSTAATWSIGQNITLTSTGALEFYNGSTRLQIDSSGNLGLGVTPSAWSGLTAYQVKSGSFANNSTLDRVYLLSNAYYNAAFKYINSNPACRFDIEGSSGSFAWYTAPSGTAGNAITFTQSLAVGKGTTLALEGATSATGTGIAFPATQSASTDANTLDDYEEGTWTPTDNSGAGLSFTGVSATYTKVGRLVNCLCELNYPVTASVAAASIAGLPFTSSNTQANRSGGVVTISTTSAVQRIYPVSNNTTFPLLNATGAATTNVNCSGAQFNFCITFYT